MMPRYFYYDCLATFIPWVALPSCFYCHCLATAIATLHLNPEWHCLTTFIAIASLHLYAEWHCLATLIAIASLHLFPEWPHIGKVVASHAEGCKVDPRLRLHRFIICMRRSGGTAHERRGGGVRPSLTPLSVANCDRLQPGVPHWATLVDYGK